MAAKSIIDVEINDGAWRSFSKQVEQHQENLKKLPGQWGMVGKSLAKTQSAGAKFTATIKEHVKQFKEANTASGKMTLAIKASDRAATSLVRNTFKVAKNMKDATKSLLSWGSVMGLISGVLGAGGLFGITRMAANISGGQTSALRTGSTYGATKAAGIAYGPLLGGAGGVESLLSTIAKEKESGGLMFKRLSGFGMKEDAWKNKSPAEILGPFLDAVKKAYKSGPEETGALRMQTLAPELDFNTIKDLSQRNIEAMQQFYEAKKKELDLSAGTQETYTRFGQVIDSISTALENMLAVALRPMMPALSKFGEGLRNAAKIILTSPMLKGLVSGAGKALEKGAQYLTSEEFSNDFKGFISELRDIGAAMHDTAMFLRKWLGTESTPEAATAEEANINAMSQNTDRRGMQHPGAAGATKIDLGKSFTTVRVDVFTHDKPGSSVHTSALAAAK